MGKRIEWKGGECPVHPDTLVNVLFRDGYEHTKQAGEYRWEHIDMCADIIAYEVIEEAKEEHRQIDENELWKDFAVTSFKRYVEARMYTYHDCASYAADEADQMIKAWDEIMKARAK